MANDAPRNQNEAVYNDPLGIQLPLLPAPALGQTIVRRKFLVPLGAQSLTVLDPSIFLHGFTDEPNNFQEPAFFDQPTSANSAESTTLQRSIRSQIERPAEPHPNPSPRRRGATDPNSFMPLPRLVGEGGWEGEVSADNSAEKTIQPEGVEIADPLRRSPLPADLQSATQGSNSAPLTAIAAPSSIKVSSSNDCHSKSEQPSESLPINTNPMASLLKAVDASPDVQTKITSAASENSRSNQTTSPPPISTVKSPELLSTRTALSNQPVQLDQVTLNPTNHRNDPAPQSFTVTNAELISDLDQGADEAPASGFVQSFATVQNTAIDVIQTQQDSLNPQLSNKAGAISKTTIVPPSFELSTEETTPISDARLQTPPESLNSQLNSDATIAPLPLIKHSPTDAAAPIAKDSDSELIQTQLHGLTPSAFDNAESILQSESTIAPSEHTERSLNTDLIQTKQETSKAQAFKFATSISKSVQTIAPSLPPEHSTAQISQLITEIPNAHFSQAESDSCNIPKPGKVESHPEPTITLSPPEPSKSETPQLISDASSIQIQPESSSDRLISESAIVLSSSPKPTPIEAATLIADTHLVQTQRESPNVQAVENAELVSEPTIAPLSFETLSAETAALNADTTPIQAQLEFSNAESEPAIAPPLSFDHLPTSTTELYLNQTQLELPNTQASNNVKSPSDPAATLIASESTESIASISDAPHVQTKSLETQATLDSAIAFSTSIERLSTETTPLISGAPLVQKQPESSNTQLVSTSEIAPPSFEHSSTETAQLPAQIPGTGCIQAQSDSITTLAIDDAESGLKPALLSTIAPPAFSSVSLEFSTTSAVSNTEESVIVPPSLIEQSFIEETASTAQVSDTQSTQTQRDSSTDQFTSGFTLSPSPFLEHLPTETAPPIAETSDAHLVQAQVESSNAQTVLMPETAQEPVDFQASTASISAEMLGTVSQGSALAEFTKPKLLEPQTFEIGSQTTVASPEISELQLASGQILSERTVDSATSESSDLPTLESVVSTIATFEKLPTRNFSASSISEANTPVELPYLEPASPIAASDDSSIQNSTTSSISEADIPVAAPILGLASPIANSDDSPIRTLAVDSNVSASSIANPTRDTIEFLAGSATNAQFFSSPLDESLLQTDASTLSNFSNADNQINRISQAEVAAYSEPSETIVRDSVSQSASRAVNLISKAISSPEIDQLNAPSPEAATIQQAPLTQNQSAESLYPVQSNLFVQPKAVPPESEFLPTSPTISPSSLDVSVINSISSDSAQVSHAAHDSLKLEAFEPAASYLEAKVEPAIASEVASFASTQANVQLKINDSTLRLSTSLKDASIPTEQTITDETSGSNLAATENAIASSSVIQSTINQPLPVTQNNLLDEVNQNKAVTNVEALSSLIQLDRELAQATEIPQAAAEDSPTQTSLDSYEAIDLTPYPGIQNIHRSIQTDSDPEFASDQRSLEVENDQSFQRLETLEGKTVSFSPDVSNLENPSIVQRQSLDTATIAQSAKQFNQSSEDSAATSDSLTLPQILQTLGVLQPLTQPSVETPAIAPNSVKQNASTSKSDDRAIPILRSQSSEWTPVSNLISRRAEATRSSSKQSELLAPQVATGSVIQAAANSSSTQLTDHSPLETATDDRVSADIAEQFDTIAQAIYSCLKQRLRVEQERYGRDYSGRLSW